MCLPKMLFDKSETNNALDLIKLHLILHAIILLGKKYVPYYLEGWLINISH